LYPIQERDEIRKRLVEGRKGSEGKLGGERRKPTSKSKKRKTWSAQKKGKSKPAVAKAEKKEDTTSSSGKRLLAKGKEEEKD